MRRRPLRLRTPLCAVLAAAGLVVVTPVAAVAQVTPVVADSSVARTGVSPRGAFLRAVAIPGWGHASIGSYNRGAFYFATETASMWMFARSRTRLFEARRRAEARETFLRAGAAQDGIDDAEALQALLDDDPLLGDLRGLEEARRQQREDWAAVSIFLMLLSGADAYVSSHLKDFPDPIDLSVTPVGDGRMELRVDLRLRR